MPKINYYSTRNYIMVLALAWTIIVAILVFWAIQGEKNNTTDLAIAQARAYFNKDKALRLWASRHGRIYVPITDFYWPDENMAHIPERDITTPSGIELTLINPARIIRQLDEEYGFLYGVTGKVTSFNPLSEQNEPDTWEKKALRLLEQGQDEILEFTEENGQSYLRLMQPLYVDATCLACHFEQPFVIGKPGGGVSIKLPMEELKIREAQNIASKLYSLIGLWLFGLIGLGLSYFLIRQHDRERRLSEYRKSAVIETALDCIITIDRQDKILEFNPAAERTFGYKKEEVIGKPLADTIIPHSLRQKHCQALERQVKSNNSTILGTRIETTALHADGHEFPVELSVNRIDVEGEILFTAYLRDITKERALTQKLLHQATHDDLTGLLNRHTFEQSLRIACSNVPAGQQHCLFYIDLDRFKIINDSCGHQAGDELLRQVAHLFKQNIAEGDILGRLGGNEFALLVRHCSREQAKRLGKKLLQAIAQYRFYWDDKIFALSISIGIIFIEAEDHVTDLLVRADAACYRAKTEGRNRYFIDDDSNLKSIKKRREEINWLNKIQTAFEQNRFQLYHQPIFSLENDQKPSAIEILIRLFDENQELIPPSRFLPAAEHYNLMSMIDRWVIRRTFEWLQQMGEEAPNMICINLSGESIVDPLFLDFVLEALQKYQVPAHKICLEITETIAITNFSRAMQFIKALKAAGCLFALDDFGSGMSSYGYLKNFPVDILKIDGQFVCNIDTDEINRAMVKSMNEIGQLMGKRTIAEFIENEVVLNMLKEMGVNYAQGFYLGKVKPLSELKPSTV